ncbi:MAG: tail fiber protein [Reichenbachiella sp.]|uniref:phage tail protein n=1 Tax=Reichenbachiella sp. TaxID=2184521 RepID=UPI00329A69BD
MSTFIGEIKLFAGNFIPRGWLACEGQILAINQYRALSSLIGNYYGGNGTTTFALPNFSGRVPLGAGTGPGLTPRAMGQFSGVETVSLVTNQIPSHNHLITNKSSVDNQLTVTGSGTLKCASVAGNTDDPADSYPAKTKAVGGDKNYTTENSQATATMNNAALDISTNLSGNIGVAVDSNCGNTGGGLAHDNMQPWICINYIINFNGVFPDPN